MPEITTMFACSEFGQSTNTGMNKVKRVQLNKTEQHELTYRIYPFKFFVLGYRCLQACMYNYRTLWAHIPSFIAVHHLLY